MTKRHSAKRVIVTGGGSGIGLAVARRFIDEGARLCLFDLSDQSLSKAHGDLRSRSEHPVLTVNGSVAAPDDVARCFAEIDRAWSGIDCVVNAAGILVKKPALDLGIEEWRRVIDVNLTGTWLVAQAAAKRMAKAGSGVIINISSTLGHGGAADRVSYCASKAGVIGLTQSLAVEWGALGIRVNSIAPTATRTPFVQELIDRALTDVKSITQRTPLGRFAEPEEIAAACSFIASDDAAMVTGHDLAVDGGWLANRYV